MARLMTVITSNAYKDREGEIVKQDALTGYVESCWKGDEFIGTNPLLVWHGGNPIGEIVFADMIGPFLLEVFRELPDAIVDLGDGVQASIKEVWDRLEARDDLGASHEFKHIKGDDKDSVYEMIVKTETSVLPRESAANAYTMATIVNQESIS